MLDQVLCLVYACMNVFKLYKARMFWISGI